MKSYTYYTPKQLAQEARAACRMGKRGRYKSWRIRVVQSRPPALVALCERGEIDIAI